MEHDKECTGIYFSDDDHAVHDIFSSVTPCISYSLLVFFLLKQKQYISTHKKRLVGNLPVISHFLSDCQCSRLTDPLLPLEPSEESFL